MDSATFRMLVRFAMSAVTLGCIALLAGSALRCAPEEANGPNPLDSNDLAFAIVQPRTGDRFSVKDTVTVIWNSNVAIIGTQPQRSFIKEFSLDSGKSWNLMRYNPLAVVDSGNIHFVLPWIVLDTNEYYPAQDRNFIQEDFLNKEIQIHIISYPPESFTKTVGNIRFHE
jgi:hypothetical protein